MNKSFALLTILGAAALAPASMGCSSESDSNPALCANDPGACNGDTFDEARSELAHDAAPNVSEADAKALVDGNTAFGLDLLQRVTADEPDGNVVVSPISATAALAMTYAGARGDTATEMATALRFTLPAERLHPAMNQLSMTLDDRNIAKHTTEEGDKRVDLNLVNSLWAAKGYGFASEFLDGLAVNYDAGVRLLDFAAEPDASRIVINDWVSDQTHSRIEDLLPGGSITSSTRLVLVNALYFYGSWATVFDKDRTSEQAFHAPTGDVQASMMHDGRQLAYAEGEGYQVIDLPYDGDQLAMRIVLPEAGQLAAVRAALTLEWMSSVDAAMGPRAVDLSLPKFSFKWGSTSLRSALEAMGMKQAFTGDADFSGMTAEEQLSVSDVLQQAFIGVDEAGTEAAAATAVLMAGTSAPDDVATFTADRPFVFFIRDASGSILFAGQVNDPTK